MKSYFLLFLFLSIILNSCTNDDNSNSSEIPEGTNLRINYFNVDCSGENYQRCLLVQDKESLGTKDWEYFYNDIEGFKFEHGYIYNIEVEKTEITNSPTDTASIKYKLIRVISKETIKCNFKDPTKDLDWLSFEVKRRETNTNEDIKYCYITQAELNNKIVFIYRDCNPVINKITPVYDCRGRRLGILGFTKSRGSTTDLIDYDELKNEKVIWQPANFVCQPIF